MAISSEKRWIPVMAYRDGKGRSTCFSGDGTYSKCQFLGWTGDQLTCFVNPKKGVVVATSKTYMKKKTRPHDECPVWHLGRTARPKNEK